VNGKKRNLMKKIIAVFFLPICALVVLLATVDLEPYLAPDRTGITKDAQNAGNVLLPPKPGTDEPLNKADETGQAGTHSTELPVSGHTSAQPQSEDVQPEDVRPEDTSVDKNIPRQEHTITLSQVKVEEATEEGEGKLEIIPSPLSDMEVTILPVAEYPFSILLETFAEQDIAELAIPYYQKRGISAHWVKVNLEEKGVLYRLFTGAFSTIPEAQQYIDQKQLVDKPIKPTIYSARIGTYQDKTQLTNAFVRTSATGAIPYILGTKKGVYHLYVGAFYTYVGAVAQCRELTDAGLSCEPVKRSTIPPQYHEPESDSFPHPVMPSEQGAL
jgi:hypothetical protein